MGAGLQPGEGTQCPATLNTCAGGTRKETAGKGPSSAVALKLSLETERRRFKSLQAVKGIEHGSPTSWVTALITGLGDKKGMTAAVVNPTSYILEDFFSFSCKCLK